MSDTISPNTQAILLLTAPLIAGRTSDRSVKPLTPKEYRILARFLHENHRQPADLLSSDGEQLLEDFREIIERKRLTHLLSRRFLLGQVVERWQSRAIWVTSRADAQYPRRLKERLREYAPPVLYGCGDLSLLDGGGLAAVGSRHVDEDLLDYAMSIGVLAARAGRTLVSGGARGIDRASMRGALESGGRSVGVLADGLERAALQRENREFLIEGQLTLSSPYDPAAGFNVGNAMQRNKLIYAFADAALVVSTDLEKGGTWTGAVEQLGKVRLLPLYVRSDGAESRGLDALRRRGAISWPNPASPESLIDLLEAEFHPQNGTTEQPALPLDAEATSYS